LSILITRAGRARLAGSGWGRPVSGAPAGTVVVVVGTVVVVGGKVVVVVAAARLRALPHPLNPVETTTKAVTRTANRRAKL
jgi:hypothetical protein